MIELRNISKSFGDNLVLDKISLKISGEESIGIMGKSGSGKTTLVRILLRLIREDSGQILYKGEDITHKSGRDLKEFRKDIQLISQRPESFFDPTYRIIGSLKEPLKNFGIFDQEKFDEEIEKKLEDLKLSKALLSRYPHQLSGGEIQRFAIIRALLLKPKILVLDECTSMLDISVQAQILNLLKGIREKEKLNYLVISHEKEIIDFMCSKMIRIEKGKLLFE